MKRFLLGVLVGVILTLFVQSHWPEILKSVGMDPDKVSKNVKQTEKSVRQLLDDTGEIAEEAGEKIKQVGKKAQELTD